MPKLHLKMSVEEFDQRYHYVSDLKVFARDIGIKVGMLRKMELEELIRDYLRTGVVPTQSPSETRRRPQIRDELKPDRHVINYVGDRITKTFLLDLVHRQVPNVSNKSGQWYWLNDWRRKRQQKQERFTYQDLANQLGKLMQTKGRLPQIPSARMNNFISDFLSDSINRGIPRNEALKAWEWLKTQPCQKTYSEYRRLRSAISKPGTNESCER